MGALSTTIVSIAVRSMLRGLLSSRRISQFALVGVAAAVTDMSVLGLLHGGAGVALLPAKIGAAESGILVAFVLNERWTFSEEGVDEFRAVGSRFLTSNAIRVVGIGVATGILVFLHTGFDVWFLLANAVGLAVGGVVNYVFEALWTWEIHR